MMYSLSQNIENSIESIIDMIKTNSFYIYGTGFVAGLFYDILKEKKLEKSIIGFIESKKSKTHFMGIEVEQVDTVKNLANELVLICVHESIKDDIVETLEQGNNRNYIWIYPYLWGIKFHNRFKGTECVNVNDLVVKNRFDYKLAIRYLVIEQYAGLNSVGYDIYIKAFRHFNSENTAEKRLRAFIEMIKEWDKRGYDSNYPIAVNLNKMIIDGHHRVALAKFYNISKIKCNIYATHQSVDDIYGQKAAMTEIEIEGLGLDKLQLKQLRECRKNLANEG